MGIGMFYLFLLVSEFELINARTAIDARMWQIHS